MSSIDYLQGIHRVATVIFLQQHVTITNDFKAGGGGGCMTKNQEKRQHTPRTVEPNKLKTKKQTNGGMGFLNGDKKNCFYDNCQL